MKAKHIALLLVFYVFTCNQVISQDAFGIVSHTEKALKECSFDKTADAVVIYDKAKSYYNDNYNLITERTIKFKILKERGIEGGNISIPYYSYDKFEEISEIKAIVNTPDETGFWVVSELGRKNIFNKQINRYYSELSFALPNIKVGSIVEYRYKSFMKSYSGLQRWEFQTDIPVMHGAFELYPFPNSEFAYTVYKKRHLPITIVPDNKEGKIYFEMNNIPGLREEAFATSSRQYLQRVNFQFSSYKSSNASKTTYINSWKDLAKEMGGEKSFGGQATKTHDLKTVLGDLSNLSAFNKMRLIHQFVKSSIAWDHIQSKYSELGVKATLEKKKGNSGDINILLISMLRSAGLDAYPLLVSERSHGKVDTTYPFLEQFNKVVAYVKIEKDNYILDGTDYLTPSHMIPVQLLNTIGFIVDRKSYLLIQLQPLQHQQKEYVHTLATISDDGKVRGTTVISDFDYSKLSKVRRYKSDKISFQENLIKPYNIHKLDSFIVNGVDDDSLVLTQQLSFQAELKRSGNYHLLNYNLFTEFDKNPFLSEHRFSDIDFGTKYSSLFSSSFELPSNLIVESIPSSKELVTPDRSMTVSRQIEKVDNKVNITIRVSFDRINFSTDEYQLVKGFYKDLVELLNEPVVLKSK